MSFRASDSSVVTLTPRNYASKSNFKKRCCFCYDNEIGPNQKMGKKINNTGNQCQTCGSSTFLRQFLQICTSYFERCRDILHD